MKNLFWTLVLLLPLAQESKDFGSKFFDDLRSLFGQLQKSELQRAFQRAKPVRCSDLGEQSGEWKEVAFLNDDRKLGDWHFDNIEEVKSDLAAFVFSGTCRGEEGPLRVAVSFPVQESAEQFQEGKIPFSQIVISKNNPVSVIFDRTAEAYTFELPFVYRDRNDNSSQPLYTLAPPRTASKPEPGLAIEFRCKALSGAELTYRFLLCRTRMMDRNRQGQRQSQNDAPGNSAYYILSDGKEASSSVKLSFGGAETTELVAEPAPEPAADTRWRAAAPQARLVDIAANEFRLQFNPQAWKGRTDKAQLLSGGTISDFPATATPGLDREYCVWRPGAPGKAGDDVLYTLAFRKEVQSAISAVFEMENSAAVRLGTLQCYFPTSQTPADVSVSRWLSIVGTRIALEVRQ